MSDLPARRPPSTLARAVSYVRALLPSAARTPPPSLGVSSRRVARNHNAAAELARLSTSPTVYAAVTRRSLTLARFPIRVYRGLDPKTAIPLEPERIPWVAALLRLLQTPDPDDLGALFPARPGVIVWAQVIADLIAAGDAYVVPVGSGELVAGLQRVHPVGASLVTKSDGEYWRFGQGFTGRDYPRRSVAHIKMLSASAGADGEFGLGACQALAPMLDAEEYALKQTAAKIQQGGVDLVVTGKDATTLGFLKSKSNREAIAEQVSEALSGGGSDRRVFVLGGHLDIKDAGFKPADLQSKELLAATERKTLQSLGTVPIALGAEASTFATAVQQYRAQADMDAGIVALLESALFRPLAQQFARNAGGRWSGRADQVTCRFDLSTHPGNIYARSEAIDRVGKLVALGWSAEQAAAAEGLDLPAPEGQASAPPAQSTPTPGTGPAPLGDVEPSTPEPATGDDPERAAIVEGLRRLGRHGLIVEAVAAK